MLRPEHPEVLTADWLPPFPIGRQAELAELLEQLARPIGGGGLAGGAFVVGGAGTGTSTLARLAGRRKIEDLRRDGRSPDPVLVNVRVRWCRGTHGVATALLQRLDEGFRGRGFPVAEILAGFLRRLRRERRSFVVVLDDIGPAAPEIGPVVRALVDPDRFLPEGEFGMPPGWLIVAGTPEARATLDEAQRAGIPGGHRVDLAPYPPELLRAIVRDRIFRAFGRPISGDGLDRLAERIVDERLGATRAMDLLRRELLGSAVVTRSREFVSGRSEALHGVEPRVLRALERAARRSAVTLGEVREWEARFARDEGVRPLPATTLWRRMVRLEAAGLLRRTVRSGGAGGTLSTIELLRGLPTFGPSELGPGNPRAPSAPSNVGAVPWPGPPMAFAPSRPEIPRLRPGSG